MQCQVVKIGTSRGIRIPAKVLHALGDPGSFELRSEEGFLVLQPQHKNPRAGWREAFMKMAESGEDTPLIDDTLDLSDWGKA